MVRCRDDPSRSEWSAWSTLVERLRNYGAFRLAELLHTVSEPRTEEATPTLSRRRSWSMESESVTSSIADGGLFLAGLDDSTGVVSDTATSHALGTGMEISNMNANIPVSPQQPLSTSTLGKIEPSTDEG